MKYFFPGLILFFSCWLSAQSGPNDCAGYVQVCGNYDIEMDVSGYGVQEIGWNACNSQEHNSLWLHFNIEEGGTLGFNLIPGSASIHEDYDFWIFGPDVSCGNLGQSIRCSTTNPQAAGQANNWTGLNETSTENSEGPGQFGDSFVSWLNVEAGESYFLVIDRPIGNSSFRLEWTGTAILENPLEDYTLYNIPPVQLCDVGNDGTEDFDFSQLDSQWINNLNGIEITYHLSESDAFADMNALPALSSVATRTYYVRIENAGSKCFEIKELRIVVDGLPLLEPEVSICDRGNDGNENYDLTTVAFWENQPGFTATYFSSLEDAQNNVSPVEDPSNVAVSNNQNTFYVRVSEGECVDFTQVNFRLTEMPEAENITDYVCNNEISGSFSLTPYITQFSANPQFQVKFYHSASDRESGNEMQPGVHTVNLGENVIYVRIFNSECFLDRTLTINVLEQPDIGENETITVCQEEFPFQISVPENFGSYSWGGQSVSTPELTVMEAGIYEIEVINEAGCISVKTFTVEMQQLPVIQAVDVYNENRIEVHVAENHPELLYSLDNGNWQTSSSFDNVEPGWHSVQVKFPNGCISEPFSTYLLKITNFLTPNGDGLNDVWHFPGLDEFEGSMIHIYDRYGKKIYEEDGSKPFIWDGTYNGSALPTGDYWYIINLPDSRKRSGHITIMN